MKFRVHNIVDNRVSSTALVEADTFEAAEAEAGGEADRHLVEPIPACAGCGMDLVQPDPRTAKYANGEPVYPDPLRAFDGIRCLACGPAPKLERGERVELIRDVDRFPHFIAKGGMVGTVTEATDDLVGVRMDDHLAGAEEWDNEVCWSREDDPTPGLLQGAMRAARGDLKSRRI